MDGVRALFQKPPLQVGADVEVDKERVDIDCAANQHDMPLIARTLTTAPYKVDRYPEERLGCKILDI
jgi:hypothetical protein